MNLPESTDPFAKIDMGFLRHVCEYARARLIGVLRDKMRAWDPPPSVLERYPFLANREKFLQDYASCMQIAIDSSGAARLVLDPVRMTSLGISNNLIAALEYGDRDIPVMEHLRLAALDAEEFAVAARGYI